MIYRRVYCLLAPYGAAVRPRWNEDKGLEWGTIMTSGKGGAVGRPIGPPQSDTAHRTPRNPPSPLAKTFPEENLISLLFLSRFAQQRAC